MDILVFVSEISAIMYLFYAFHIEYTESRFRRCAAGCLFIIWLLLLSISTFFRMVPSLVLIIWISAILYKGKFLYKWIWIQLFALIEGMIYHLLLLFSKNWLHFNVFWGQYIEKWIDLLAVFGTCMILVRTGKAWDYTILMNLPGRKLAGVLAVLLLTFLLVAAVPGIVDSEIGSFGRIFLVFLVDSGVLILFGNVYLMMRLYMQHIRMEDVIELQRSLLEKEKEQYQALMEANHSLHAFRHDHNAHVRALQTLVQSGKYDEVTEYIRSMESFYELHTREYHTGSLICDSCLQYYDGKLPEGINIGVVGRFPPEVFVDDVDMCVIFSNLLRNAVTAVSKVDQESDPHINVLIDPSEDQLRFLFENDYNMDPDVITPESRYASTREGSRPHGFGLQNVKDAVKHYDGRLRVFCRNSVFFAELLLYRI